MTDEVAGKRLWGVKGGSLEQSAYEEQVLLGTFPILPDAAAEGGTDSCLLETFSCFSSDADSSDSGPELRSSPPELPLAQ